MLGKKNYTIVDEGSHASMHIKHKGSIVCCLIDNEDVGRVSSLSWHATKAGYVCHTYRVGRRISSTRLHNFIMNTPNEIDHINRNKLDCRKLNLRICNKSQNQWNRNVDNRSVSGVKGVRLIRQTGKWDARFNANRKIILVGRFDDKESAIHAIRDARISYHGEFSCHG